MSERYAIMLAEDDENDVFFFQRAARDAGITHPILVAHDGQEAIDFLSGAAPSQFPKVCLLILDLKMPRKTGLDVLEWLSKSPRMRTLPVIILSSSAQPEDIDRAYLLGANAFVVKPSSVETRADLMQMIKGFWLRFNNPPSTCWTGDLQVPTMHNRDIQPIPA
jgi:CheY-like chemotaxis protein